MLWPFKRNLSNGAFEWNFFFFFFLENDFFYPSLNLDFFCFKNTKMIMSDVKCTQWFKRRYRRSKQLSVTLNSKVKNTYFEFHLQGFKISNSGVRKYP